METKKEKGTQKRRVLAAAGGALALAAVCGVSIGVGRAAAGSAAAVGTGYGESEAVTETLTVGVTESGKVEVGVTEQTFDLDISEFTASAEGFSWETGMDMGRGGGTSAGSRALQVETVYITQGQEIAEGDPLVKLTEESVEAIRGELETDVTEAQTAWEKVKTEKELTVLQAEQEYTKNVAYGSLAENEYAMTMKELEEAAADLQEQITEKEETIAALQEEIQTCQTERETEQTVLENAEYVVENTDVRQDVYSWAVGENAREEAQAIIEELEEKEENAQEEMETASKELTDLQDALTEAQKALKTGEIEAKNQYEIRNLRAQNAQELYDVAVERSEFEEEQAQEAYEEAREKLEAFDARVVDGVISAACSGIVTEVTAIEGSEVATDTVLAKVSDYGDVTVTVTVEEADLARIETGDQVQVAVAALEEAIAGTVEEISDAQYNSSTGKNTYEVTVKLEGEQNQVYEGMSAEVTFIQKETDPVLTVSNRAVTRENGKSYVQVKGEDGTIEKREVETGFSDGSRVEIKEGLSEGETVLTGSKAGVS